MEIHLRECFHPELPLKSNCPAPFDSGYPGYCPLPVSQVCPVYGHAWLTSLTLTCLRTEHLPPRAGLLLCLSFRRSLTFCLRLASAVFPIKTLLYLGFKLHSRFSSVFLIFLSCSSLFSNIVLSPGGIWAPLQKALLLHVPYNWLPKLVKFDAPIFHIKDLFLNVTVMPTY